MVKAQKIDGYVAYLDILGFSERVTRLSFDDEFDRYSEIIGTAAQENGGLRYATFSDSVVLNTDGKTRGAFEGLLHAVAEITYRLLVELDVPVCGAISAGRFSRLVSDNENLMIAGVPLVEAVSYETRQDWLGVILSPSVLKADPDLEERARFDKCRSKSDGEKLREKLPWPILAQKCLTIPFHSANDLVDNQFAGYVVVPHQSQSSTPESVLADLDVYRGRLDYLKLVAPGPSAQRKYTRASNWLFSMGREWEQALSGWWPDPT